MFSCGIEAIFGDMYYVNKENDMHEYHNHSVLQFYYFIPML